ncbi:SprT-like domain-containing protein [Myroides odoratimimus]|uniref:SprT-like domain-containing protein n=1 Tax=Myroides odoratimimus TaxID=76832 RepID=UPI002578026A|nr:SprT-like domain-containing protein [Myroides odoratimimus]MDM1399011.1 SprT-like domain-containing protein [Myroides odoratimimus]
MKPTQEFYDFFQYLFDKFNENLFDNTLPQCLIVITRKNKTFGYYSSRRWANNENTYTDELAINPLYFNRYPFIEILQTIVHEMCHLWQQHNGNPSQRTYHNKEWADKMESIGLIPSTTGKKGGKRTGQNMMDYPSDTGAFIMTCIDIIYDPIIKNLWFDKTRNNPVPFNNEINIDTNSTTFNENKEAMYLLYSIYDANNFTEADLDTEQDSEEIEESENTADKKNKVKYTCDCGFNVWGKPDLKILCQECNSLYQSV